VGRDGEFCTLERALRTRRVVVIHGVGGTGKTELAKGFARWLQASGGLDDPAGVFFHSFEPGVASFGLDGVVTSLGLRRFGPAFVRETRTPEERRRVVLDVLRQQRLLLLWDNFETVHSLPDPTGATPPLNDAQRETMGAFLAEVGRAARGAVLITSRSPEPWLGNGVHRLELGGMGHPDALELADYLLAPFPTAQTRRQDRAYGKLLETLGGHPLSVRLILPHLERVEPQTLVEALRSERELPEGFAEREDRLGSLAACAHYSFRHLPAEHRQRLPALTLFEGVVDVAALVILSQTEEAPPRFRGLDKGAWEETLQACVGGGLLTRLGAGMYHLHPALPSYVMGLWRAEAAEAFEAERAAARAASIRAHAALGEWLLQQVRSGHAETALAVLAADRRTLGAVAGEALKQGRHAEAQAVLQPLNELWNNRGLAEEARGWVDRCRVAVEGPDGLPPDRETPAGALWLFMVSSQAGRLLEAGGPDATGREYEAIRRTLEASKSPAARQRLAVSYHQLGTVAEWVFKATPGGGAKGSQSSRPAASRSTPAKAGGTGWRSCPKCVRSHPPLPVDRWQDKAGDPAAAYSCSRRRVVRPVRQERSAARDPTSCRRGNRMVPSVVS
jgi:hypothetical protein